MSSTRLVFEVGNTLTQVHGGDEFILRILDLESRYPTDQAALVERAGWNATHEGSESNAGKWDGWVRLFKTYKTRPPSFPTGLLSRLERISRKHRYGVQIHDTRVRPEAGFPEMMGKTAIVDRDYQLAAADAAELAGRGVLDMPPRSGKTRVMCEIHRRIALPTIWIAPTDRIVTQTQEVLEHFFGHNYSMHLVGTSHMDPSRYSESPPGETDRVRKARLRKLVEAKDNLSRIKDMQVVVCTAATASRLSAEFYATRQVVVVDEFHHGASKTFTKDIFPKLDHCFYRFGMTGTFFRSNGDDMAMHSLLSETIFKVESSFLLERGYLVPTKVVYLPIPKNPMLRGVPKNFVTGHGKFGIHTHKHRNQLAGWAAATLHKMGRKTIVLVGTKQQGRAIQKYVEAFIPEKSSGQEFSPCEFVSTDKDRPIQGRILDAFLNSTEVNVLIGTSLLGEGVDLPNVDALVYARGEKASVSLKQNAYRVCTAVEGKTDSIIVDFADRHHSKLLAHSHERLNIYRRESTFGIEVLHDANQFASWLSTGEVAKARV